MSVQGVSLSPFSGRGQLKGLVVGNPEGFKTPTAIQVGSVGVALQPSSVLSDKVVIQTITVAGPEITLEQTPQGNNLNKILDNVRGTAGPGQPAGQEEAKAKTRKLEVDDLLISGGKVRLSASLLGGKAMTVPLPEIHLTDLGRGPEGITPAELTEKVLRAVIDGALKSAAGGLGNMGNAVTGGAKDLSTGAVGTAEKALKGVGGLFQKK